MFIHSMLHNSEQTLLRICGILEQKQSQTFLARGHPKKMKSREVKLLLKMQEKAIYDRGSQPFRIATHFRTPQRIPRATSCGGGWKNGGVKYALLLLF